MGSSFSLKSRRIDNRFLGRLVVIMLIAAVLITAVFGVYYYSDRYIFFGDKTPAELQIEEIKEIVAQNPKDLEARVAMAQQYYENGDFSQAIQQAETVLKARPNDPAALFLLGVSYSDVEQTDAAVAMLQRLAEIRRESEMAQIDQLLEAALYYLGLNYIKLNQADAAIEVLSEALAIDGTDADGLYQLGLAYALNGQHEWSIDAYQKAVMFVPDFAEAYQGMTKSFKSLGKDSEALYAQGMLSFSNNDLEKAEQQLRQAAEGLPDNVPVYLGLALTYEEQGEYGMAMKFAERVLQLEPDNFNAQVILSRLGSMGSGG